ncbi:hypothetical protein [Bizionia sp.]|uniref:hypothetical protein n=1 Tax=Bizionia sp. TaxID=1954480 RepID=UPI003A92E993
MKYIPILFSTNMVQAILEGRKTQTRRVIKNFPNSDEAINLKDVYEHSPEYFYEVSPYGKPGDILWVRETFRKVNHYGFDYEFHQYKAGGTSAHCEVIDMDQLLHDDKWKPSIHMPKAACRIFLKITDVRVERLQDISEQDAIAEGIEKLGASFGYRNYLNKAGLPVSWYSSYHSFQSLWENINGSDNWKSNPWVWVISFERTTKPEGLGRISNLLNY